MVSDKENLKPDFIGIGAMKCATTWLSECLRCHPDIYMSSPKEIHFFSAHYEKELEWYLDHFKESDNFKIRGEFSTSYLPNNEVPIRIKETLGEVKLLVSLRNPVERFISHYKHYLRDEKLVGNLNLKNYQKSIEKYPELLDRGNYSDQLKKYIENFGFDNIKIIIKENIDSKPKEVLGNVYSFLNVDSNFVPPLVEKKVSPGITPKIQLLENLRKMIFSLAKSEAPWFIDLVKKFRIPELYRKLNNKKTFQVDLEVKDKLYDYYRNEIFEVENLIKKDLSFWKR
ncbi:sulfotransferase domain-containing protein [Acetohalobium arabaticum]|uniref:Putative sulfotransferase protein n=1 Tax=Acetohalobium arabaticum (strain ATCC 49924 / DSM 5501 / Z-7288) TaxID=574087 RepID=D9QTA7_ACEAZ|nr:sulfotransferase domain-containing protein [Acetohalobium arabaticum]ADL13607.1 putative sulfotransferase protein [Acetohalobium arabaticum DSM 5501]